MRKCKGIIGEIEAMEVAHVGVRTRSARALSMAAAATSKTANKMRKVNCGGGESKLSASLIDQLRSSSRRRVAVVTRNSVSPAASCCSSNASGGVGSGSVKVVDLEDSSFQIETSTCNFGNRGRRETTPSSEIEAESANLELTARPTEANSGRRSSAVSMRPSEIELEEFFVVAEKDLQKEFTEKYNYDISKDVPLEGRYEWIQLKP